MSNLPNFPILRPSLLLDFANSKQVDPRITFTRASTATYFDAQGLMRTAASGVPRIDHDPVTGECSGLLIEEQRTNLITYSEQFDTEAWSKVSMSISANATVAPDGTLTADKLVEDTTASSIHFVNAANCSATSTTLTASVFVKAGERTKFILQISNFLNHAAAFSFDLSAGTSTNITAECTDYTGVTSTIISLNNGWYRCILTATKGTANSSNFLTVSLVSGSSGIYTGDGTSGLYLWGAQLEVGAFPTSYIPTSTAATTRAADAASVTGTNFSEWYRQDEGTIVAEAQVAATNNYSGTFRHVLHSSQAGSSASRVSLLVSPVNQMGSEVAVSTVVGAYLVQGANTGSVFKVATAYKTNDFAFSANGTAPTTDTSGSVPSGLSQMFIGGVYGGDANGQLNGTVRRIAFFPKRLANAELQAITA